MKPEPSTSVFAQKLKYPRKIFNDILAMINDPASNTYFPNEQRKSRWQISRDILTWFFRNREVNRYYYVYGFDRKNNTRQNEIVPYNTFRAIRDRANLKPAGLNFNYASLLRDKFIFGQYLNSLRFPTPNNIAFLDSKELVWLRTMNAIPLSAMSQYSDRNIDGFCKKLTGIQGEGAFPLKIEGGSLSCAGKPITTDELKEKLSGQYLWQERIHQHPDMSRLHPESVNTIRMITFNVNGNVEVFCATQRIGAKHRSVDNWASGGIIVGIEVETGRLRNEGFFKPGKGSGRVEVHPDTGIRFEGYQLPYFKESVELACSLHRYFYGIHSVGWDIAITPEGPVFIEGNEDWDGSIPMTLEKNFKSRLLKYFE